MQVNARKCKKVHRRDRDTNEAQGDAPNYVCIQCTRSITPDTTTVMSKKGEKNKKKEKKRKKEEEGSE
jgi:hypothetical protein